MKIVKMLPLLFSIGSINIYSLGLILAVGFFISAFFIWRRLKELGIDEEKIIDLIIISALFSLVFGRIFFIIQNISLLGFNPSHWLLIGRYPGLSFWGGVGGIFLTVWWFSRRQDLDFWQIYDEFVYGLMPFLILAQVGSFFDGSGFGRPTSMPWGVYVVGSLVKRQPLPLMMAVGLFVIWLFLLRIERDWRAWRWYKSKAQGLVTLFFGSLAMGINSLVAFWRDNPLYLYWLEICLSFILLVLFAGLIYLRSGRRPIGENK